MGRAMKAVSGIASRCGSNSLSRAIAAVIIAVSTAMFGTWLWSWAAGWAAAGHDGAYIILVSLVTIAYMTVSLVTLAVMSDPPHKWTMETMTGYAPFVVWRAMISDERVTGWKLLLWPLVVPVEGLICLWLAIGWMGRLLNADLSKR